MQVAGVRQAEGQSHRSKVQEANGAGTGSRLLMHARASSSARAGVSCQAEAEALL